VSRSLPASSAFLLRRPAVGFSGSRHGVGAGLVPLLSVLPAALGSRVLVGCARGVDAVVREHVSAEVFQAASRRQAALVARSVALVSALAAIPGAVLVVVPGRACPAGLVPSASSSVCFCGLGSGSWASAALAVGLGVSVLVWVECGSWLPSSWGFRAVGGGWFALGK